MCVKRIPTEIHHVNRVLDGGQGCVRQLARLRALRTGQQHSQLGQVTDLTKRFPRSPYLKDSDLAPRDGERHRHTLAVHAKAITLAWGGEVEVAQIGDVCVPVHHCSLDVTELGCWTWTAKKILNELLLITGRVEMGLAGALVPSRLWMALVLWLGLGRKPEERPEVDEGEREGAALLLGVLRGLLEMEQPRAASCGEGEKLWDRSCDFTADVKLASAFTSLLPPVVSSFFAGVSFAGGVFVLGRLSGLRLTFPTWGRPSRTCELCLYCDCRTNRKLS